MDTTTMTLAHQKAISRLTDRLPSHSLSELESLISMADEAHADLRDQLGGPRKEVVVDFTAPEAQRAAKSALWTLFPCLLSMWREFKQAAEESSFGDQLLWGEEDKAALFTGLTHSGQKVGRFLSGRNASDHLHALWYHFRSVPAAWSYLTEAPMRVAITTELHHFLKLGHHDCDHGSCFHSEKEFGRAPIVLGCSNNTFVGYIKTYNQDRIENEGQPDEVDRNSIVARFWGQVRNGKVAMTNFYPNHDLKYTATAYLWASDALSQMGYLGPWVRMETLHGAKADGVYRNGYQITNLDDEFPYQFPDMPKELGEPGTRCDECSDYVPVAQIREISGSEVCNDCLDEYYIFVESLDEFVHQDSVVVTEDGDPQHIDDCVQLYDDTWALEENCVQLYNDTWAHRLDDCLVESVDGDWFIAA